MTRTPTARRVGALVAAFVAALVVIALAATSAVVVAPSYGGSAATAERQQARPRAADRPFVGFRIPRTDRAASGWIGSRKLGRATVVYRTDPRRTATTRRFGAARWTANFRASGGGPVGTGRTACAAYLLSSFGKAPSGSSTRRLQSAGVDVAVQHLLFGRDYRYDGRTQRRRTDQRSNGPLVRAYAKKLVTELCDSAGPYLVTLATTATSADTGDTVAYSAGVRSSSGAPMAGVRLSITPSVGPPLALSTGADGRAAFTLFAGRSGPLTVDLVTNNLPQVQVRYRVPRRAGASRVVEAGRKLGDAYPRSQTIAVVGQPTLAIDPDATVRKNQDFRMRFTLGRSYGTVRPATVRIYGPFADAAPLSDVWCGTTQPVRSQRVPVGSDKTYTSAPFQLSRKGRYVWQVSVAGDAYNKPVTLCGRRFTVPD